MKEIIDNFPYLRACFFLMLLVLLIGLFLEFSDIAIRAKADKYSFLKGRKEFIMQKNSVSGSPWDAGNEQPYYIEQRYIGDLGQDACYAFVDEKPVLRTCTNVVDWQERQTCSYQQLTRFILEKINSLEEGQWLPVKSEVVVAFIVEKDGSINEPHFANSKGNVLERLIIEGLESLNHQGSPFNPAKNNGEIVRYLYRIDI